MAWFETQRTAVAIDVRHDNGATGEYYLPEIMGSGVGLFDQDNDGDLDLYILQGSLIDGEAIATDRFYRNEGSPDGATPIEFADATEGSGIAPWGYGMGVAAGDYDRDGRVDLYLTRFGANRLLRNVRTGGFEEVATPAGVADPRWSSSATFLDFDRDGWLDLFVANYVDFTVASHKTCRDPAGRHDYCAPDAYRPAADRLYRNRRDGTFEDVSLRAGIGRVRGAGLGVVADDFDGDGWVDVYVANDRTPNRLWMNLGDGTFEDRAQLAGVAVNGVGSVEAGMGVDAGDFDDDGDPDLFVTNLRGETNTLYENVGDARFVDRTSERGLGLPSRRWTGFGTAWFDPDNDGDLDLFVANGDVFTMPGVRATDALSRYAQENRLYENDGGGRFSERAEPGAGPAAVARGAALGDLDNDGDTDIVVTNNGGVPRILLGAGSENAWIGLRVTDATGRIDLLGTRVEIVLADGRTLRRTVRAGAGYLSSHDPRVLVGLGADATVRHVLVEWPDRGHERFRDLSPRSWQTLRRGEGVPGPVTVTADDSPR